MVHAGQIEDRLKAESVELAYRLLPVGTVATIINALVLFALHWSLVPHRFLWLWLAMLLAVSAIRIVTYVAYRSAKPRGWRFWHRVFTLTLTAAGLTWGAAALFGLFHRSLPSQILVAFTLGGMVAGAAAAFSVMRSAYYGFAIPALVPQVVLFVLRGDGELLAMAVMLAVYLVLISVPAETNHRLIQSTFRLRFERQDLISSLTDERNRAEQGNVRLQEEFQRREQLDRALRAAHMELERKVDERTRELASAYEQLEQSNRELWAFSHSVSHDLRGPLQAIDGFGHLLEAEYSERLDDAGRRHLARVRSNAARMRQLIEDLLALSEASESRLERGPVNLSILAREVVENLESREPQRKVEVEIQPDCTASGDEHLIRIALENLLENAWKFTRNAERPRIEFGGTSKHGWREFWVRDNGVGFDMARAGELFRPFRRLHSGPEFPGTGVGLATVERVIRRHRGRVWAEAEPGKGARFSFTLEAS